MAEALQQGSLQSRAVKGGVWRAEEGSATLLHWPLGLSN